MAEQRRPLILSRTQRSFTSAVEPILANLTETLPRPPIRVRFRTPGRSVSHERSGNVLNIGDTKPLRRHSSFTNPTQFKPSKYLSPPLHIMAEVEKKLDKPIEQSIEFEVKDEMIPTELKKTVSLAFTSAYRIGSELLKKGFNAASNIFENSETASEKTIETSAEQQIPQDVIICHGYKVKIYGTELILSSLDFLNKSTLLFKIILRHSISTSPFNDLLNSSYLLKLNSCNWIEVTSMDPKKYKIEDSIFWEFEEVDKILTLFIKF